MYKFQPDYINARTRTHTFSLYLSETRFLT